MKATAFFHGDETHGEVGIDFTDEARKRTESSWGWADADHVIFDNSGASIEELFARAKEIARRWNLCEQ